MTITQTGLDVATQTVLDYFDNFTHIAIGTGTTAAQVSQTTLTTESFRELIYDTAKDLTQGTYVFTMFLTTVEGNVTLAEIGVFDASSSGNMGVRNVLPTTYTKLNSEEVRIQIGVEVTASN